MKIFQKSVLKKQDFPKVWMKCLEIASLQDFNLLQIPQVFWRPWAASKPPPQGARLSMRVAEPPSGNSCLRVCDLNDMQYVIWNFTNIA